jgi:hypothetical protein
MTEDIVRTDMSAGKWDEGTKAKKKATQAPRDTKVQEWPPISSNAPEGTLSEPGNTDFFQHSRGNTFQIQQFG